ncbi:hypothetical protein MBEBAB_2081 [Brevundimonas abyssalis TAR-001]|uniref:Uncharacterized protein n=2 Tax=Brevundimonas TaxID=41275 RepID=A0A8E0TT04_9CAUL|nr:hypothetical protein MBEBAB_2081 [Brevundimonas abyssalis TAR-001]
MLMNQKLTANRLLGSLSEADRMALSPYLTREAMVSGHLSTNRATPSSTCISWKAAWCP